MEPTVVAPITWRYVLRSERHRLTTLRRILRLQELFSIHVVRSEGQAFTETLLWSHPILGLRNQRIGRLPVISTGDLTCRAAASVSKIGSMRSN